MITKKTSRFTKRIRIFFKRRKVLFIVKKKLLFLVKRILILLFLVIVTRSRVIVTWSRVSTIIPGPTFYFFRNTNRSEIEPMTNKHEWKSVSFIRQSRSLHYGRFMLSSLKEGQANILGTIIRRVPLAEKQKKSFHRYNTISESVNERFKKEALATQRSIPWNPLFYLDFDREEVNQNILNFYNPLSQELKPDDLEDEELVQLIRQRYTPIQIERIWNVIETKSEGSRESDP